MPAISILKDLFYVGGNDYAAERFENLFPIPDGMAYNSYVIKDKKTVLLDTIEMPVPGNCCKENAKEKDLGSPFNPFSNLFYKADPEVSEAFLNEVASVLGQRKLDYLVVQHMEPDHSAAICRVVKKYPEAKIIISLAGSKMLAEYVPGLSSERIIIIDPSYRLDTGNHLLRFVPAPFVHWPEVIMTYDEKEQILFSADAFGAFGANKKSIFSDEMDIDEKYFSEMRRYYTNIVGKFGPQVLKVLDSAKDLPIKMILPLHGPIWRNHFADILSRYRKWASYEPEDPHDFIVLIGSIYGHTAYAASKINELVKGGKYFDITKTDISYLISEIFRVKTVILASATYAGELYPPMNTLLTDVKNIGIQNRTFGLIENGTWAPVAGARMKAILSFVRNTTVIEPTLTIHGAYQDNQQPELAAFCDKIKESIK
ncbi:MAG: FprA family A-type flavoprotein [Bacilli bacterium]|jgi:flavorubredoxin|nr:FprA family A-type flavoprotein [Bacilli bacterium]